jgi:hypothetical protein
MVVIFGWGGGNTKDLGEIAPATCPRCHNQVVLHHVRSDKQFSLYFVPISSYGGSEYLLCPVCQHGIQVQEAHRQAVTAMGSATRLYRRGGLPAETYQGQVARFWTQLGVDPTGSQVLHPAPSMPPPAAAGPAAASTVAPGASGSGSLADQVARLAELRAEGILTDEEFSAAKRKLIAG